jgi:hypothetical protein|tara:strand:- start:10039 stop:11541 length:1503 start_codon:yes stop_codon:yes gene_type:complete
MRKWGNLLDFESDDCKKVEGYHKRMTTAMLLENQEAWMKQTGIMPRTLVQETGYSGGTEGAFGTYQAGGGGATGTLDAGAGGGAIRPSGGYDGSTPPHPNDSYAAGDARLPKVLIPMIRRTFPELITNEIVGVQPMSGPVGLAFALRYRYESDNLADFSPDGSNNANTNVGENRSDGDEAGYQKLNTAHTGVSAAGLNGLGQTSSTTTSGSDFDFVDDDFGVAAILSHFELSTNIPQMTLEIEKTAVEAGTRRLATKWSIELEQDIYNMNGIDIDAEMTNAMSYEIQAEIDREMVLRMIQVALNAGSPHGYSTWTPEAADGRWFAERGVDFYAKVVVEANRVAVRNRRGPANFLIATPKVCSILQLLPEFSAFQIGAQIQAHPHGIARVGSLGGQFNIYRDTRTEAQFLAGVRTEPVEYCLLGYKGSEFWDTGLVYCPYIPVMVQRTIGPNDFSPRVGMLTRYGVIDHLFGSQNFYHLIILKNLGAAMPNSVSVTPTYMN